MTHTYYSYVTARLDPISNSAFMMMALPHMQIVLQQCTPKLQGSAHPFTISSWPRSDQFPVSLSSMAATFCPLRTNMVPLTETEFSSPFALRDCDTLCSLSAADIPDRLRNLQYPPSCGRFNRFAGEKTLVRDQSRQNLNPTSHLVTWHAAARARCAELSESHHLEKRNHQWLQAVWT